LISEILLINTRLGVDQRILDVKCGIDDDSEKTIGILLLKNGDYIILGGTPQVVTM